MRKLVYEIYNMDGNKIAQTSDYNKMTEYRNTGNVTIKETFEKIYEERKETEQGKAIREKMALRIAKMRETA